VAWPATRVAELLGVRYPIIGAPMAGGPSTPALAAAVSRGGGLGSLAGAAMTAPALRAEIHETRRLTDAPFAVNLFAPLPRHDAPPDVVARVRQVLAPWHDELGLEQPEPAAPPEAFDEQVAVAIEEQVPVLSFTFGIPLLEAARRAGLVLLGTATTAREALLMSRAGVDAVVLQGAEAGGHRGTFAGSFDEALVPLAELIPAAADAVDLPLIAAGGLVDGDGIANALRLGAEGVQLGTAFLVAPEAGTPAAHRRAVLDGGEGIVTNVYSGRHARLLRTPLVDVLGSAGAVLPYPQQASMLAALRRAGSELDRSDLLFLLAGSGAGRVRELPAAELVETLVRETAAALGS
jgi:nitronate monooxygenase